MKNGDFCSLVDAHGAADRDLRPGHRPRRERRVDARCVPGQHHPGRPHQPGGAQRCMQYYPDAEQHHGRRRAVAEQPGLGRALQQGRVLELGRQGRPQLQRQRPGVLPLGRERAQRDRATPAPSAAVRRRTASCRSGAPTARSSATGCTSSAPGRCSTCAAATPTSSSGAITGRAQLRRDRVRLARRASSSQLPSEPLGGLFPRIEHRPVRERSRAAQPRTATGTTRSSRTCR